MGKIYDNKYAALQCIIKTYLFYALIAECVVVLLLCIKFFCSYHCTALVVSTLNHSPLSSLAIFLLKIALRNQTNFNSLGVLVFCCI